jgi:hypothetical protein
MKDTVMKTKHNILNKISLGSGLAIALAFGVWLPGAARAADEMKGAHDMMHMEHIMTQAQAEARSPATTCP